AQSGASRLCEGQSNQMAQSPDFLVRGLGGSETRNQAQKPAHKDIRPKWQNQPFRSDATYAPVSNRA
ncbi:MAG: hypothetical protein ACTICJ_06025, partial [Lacticaseibacillus paracasei]|nr:hypothetical protein [Lacticaseibacillus paracasei]